MMQPFLSASVIRFEAFEIDLERGELRKQGRRLKVQEQPFRVLAMLLKRPGEVILREEMRQKLWPADTFVDFDHGLNSAVARLREALHDSASQPRLIETVPRQGYRFIGVLNHTLEQTRVLDPHRGEPGTGMQVGWIALATVLLLVLCVMGTWWLVQERAAASLPPIELVPLAGVPGFEVGPTFSPDGNQVAFLRFDGPGNSGLYIAMVGGEKPLRLTKSQRDCCATWSPDGKELAFLRFTDDAVNIYTIAALGGTERKLYTTPHPPWPGLSWSPDGKALAFVESRVSNGRSWIALLALGTSTTRPLTSPPDESRDAAAVFSPDGSKVAFVRGTVAGVVNDIYVIDAAGGRPIRLTFDNQPILGLSWTGDSRDIVFSSTRGGQASLWRVPASGGSPLPVVGAGSPAYSPSVSPKGNLLAYQEEIDRDSIWKMDLKSATQVRGAPSVLISAKGGKMRPSFSPDGKRIAFESDRMGNMEIWICGIDGENCKQVTALHGTAGTARWSPDNHHIAFEFHPDERAEIYVVDVPGGVPRMIPTVKGADNLAPSWSRDGKWIYFASKQGGGFFQLWKVSPEGGPPVQITRAGGLAAAEAADGFLYYSKYENEGIWRMPLAGGQEERVSQRPDGFDWFSWALAPDGIYVLDRRKGPKATLDFLDLKTRRLTPLMNLDKPVGWGLALSPDNKSLLYVGIEFGESNIMLVKNFR